MSYNPNTNTAPLLTAFELRFNYALNTAEMLSPEFSSFHPTYKPLFRELWLSIVDPGYSGVARNMEALDAFAGAMVQRGWPDWATILKKGNSSSSSTSSSGRSGSPKGYSEGQGKSINSSNNSISASSPSVERSTLERLFKVQGGYVTLEQFAEITENVNGFLGRGNKDFLNLLEQHQGIVAKSSSNNDSPNRVVATHTSTASTASTFQPTTTSTMAGGAPSSSPPLISSSSGTTYTKQVWPGSVSEGGGPPVAPGGFPIVPPPPPPPPPPSSTYSPSASSVLSSPPGYCTKCALDVWGSTGPDPLISSPEQKCIFELRDLRCNKFGLYALIDHNRSGSSSSGGGGGVSSSPVRSASCSGGGGVVGGGGANLFPRTGSPTGAGGGASSTTTTTTCTTSVPSSINNNNNTNHHHHVSFYFSYSPVKFGCACYGATIPNVPCPADAIAALDAILVQLCTSAPGEVYFCDFPCKGEFQVQQLEPRFFAETNSRNLWKKQQQQPGSSHGLPQQQGLAIRYQHPWRDLLKRFLYRDLPAMCGQKAIPTT